MRLSEPWRRALRVVAIALGVLALLLALALLTMERWLWLALDPGPFDPEAAPPAPDYAQVSAWAALPELDDGADAALASLPATPPDAAAADVFYVHPTTWISSSWNVPIDAPEVVEATTRGGTLIQASVFNACCAVYAPRYRQVHGRAFTHPDDDGERAKQLAYDDLVRAFDEFSARTDGRPFILAGHSQGAVLATRLLRERIVGHAERQRLVAAYLIGAPVRAGMLGGVPICDQPRATGCVVSYNARGPEFEANNFEFDADDPDAMRGLICVNPISHAADERHAEASEHGGAIFFDTDVPELVPSFADAGCEDGILIVRELGDLRRDFMSELLLWLMGPQNYHPVEYQLFYVDLRRDAVDRVNGWMEAN